MMSPSSTTNPSGLDLSPVLLVPSCCGDGIDGGCIFGDSQLQQRRFLSRLIVIPLALSSIVPLWIFRCDNRAVMFLSGDGHQSVVNRNFGGKAATTSSLSSGVVGRAGDVASGTTTAAITNNVREDSIHNADNEDDANADLDVSIEWTERNESNLAADTDVVDGKWTGRWVRVPREERARYPPVGRNCTHPFRHCCVGQCRKLENEHHDPAALYRKPDPPHADMLEVANYLGRAGAPCHVWFVGASLSVDQAMGAVCSLTSPPANYELVQCDAKKVSPHWGESHVCDDIASSGGGDDDDFHSPRQLSAVFHLRRSGDDFGEKNQTCNRIQISAANPEQALVVMNSTKFKSLGGVVVWNWGVHCHQRGCVSTAMKKWFLPLYNALSGTKQDAGVESSGKWHFLYRETEPQHFNTPGGLFPSEGKRFGHKNCKPVKNADNWRNIEAAESLERHNLIQKVPILRIFHATVPLWTNQMRVGDCTHYCFSPWRFQLTSNEMLKALAKLLPTTTSN